MKMPITYSKPKSWRFFKVLLLIMVFYSLNCWLFFNANTMLMRFAYLFLAMPFFLNARFWDTSRKRVITALLLAFLQLYCSGSGNLNLYIFTILGALPVISIVLLRDEYLVDLLDSFQNIMYPLLALGSVFWILHLVGFDLPSTEVTFGETAGQSGMSDSQYYFSNHFLYLVNNSAFVRWNADIPTFFRFSSIFSEPGYLGIMLTFLLYINKFDMQDKRNIVYLVSLALTLSLAGYIMALFAYTAHRLEKSKNRVAVLISIGIVLAIGYVFFSNYNGGNNAVNDAIIARLKVEEDGNIAGNNRTSEALDKQFEDFLTSTDLFFGVPNRNQIEFGVGYKKFLLKNGLFGLVLFLIFLSRISKRAANYRSWILFILYVLMFARGDVTMFWAAFIMIFAGGVAMTTNNRLQTV